MGISTLLVISVIYLLWLLFVVVMALKEKWHQLPLAIRILAIPAAMVGYVLDITFNLTMATILFLDFPKEFTFSQRLSRYLATGGRRRLVAKWVCSNLLDPLETGGHCKEQNRYY